jgi:hypothetical protein
VSAPKDRGAGNGDPCPLNPDHGLMFVLPSGTEYCSHTDHDEHGERPATPSLHRPPQAVEEKRRHA